MNREQMKYLLGWLLTILVYLPVQIIWQLLERLFYGQVTPRVVDTIIGCLIVFLVRHAMTDIVNRLEVKYLKCLFEDLIKALRDFK